VKVRFLADADLNRAIVSGVLRREPSVDFLTAHAAGLRRMTDPEVLALAAGLQRVIVSHDVGTMPTHFRALRNAGKHSAAYSSFLKALTWEQQSRNFCSSGLHRGHRSGKTGWGGCRFENHQDTRYVASQDDQRQAAL